MRLDKKWRITTPTGYSRLEEKGSGTCPFSYRNGKSGLNIKKDLEQIKKSTKQIN